MHDELIGMMEGEKTQPLYNVNTEETPPENSSEDRLAKAEEDWTRADQEYWVAAIGTKGKGGKGKKGIGDKGNSGKKGYGECWNFGQHGHPARERIVPGKLHGGVGQGDGGKSGSVAVIQGKKGWKGKGKGWKGKNAWKGKGKGSGKQTLNAATEVEYKAAWEGADGEDHWWGEPAEYQNSYNYMVAGNWQTPSVPRHYSMMLVPTTTPVTTGPKYFPSMPNEDSDDEEVEEDSGKTDTSKGLNSNACVQSIEVKHATSLKLKR